MRKRENSGQRWLDYEEDEVKVRKNLSRLIHTVQQIPSNRVRMDTTSLWNLIGELESFRPATPTKSMQFIQKTTKKTFSKKYLDLRLCPSPDRDLRLCPSPDRSRSPEIRKPNKKAQKEDNNKPQSSNKTQNEKSNTIKKRNEKKVRTEIYWSDNLDANKNQENKLFNVKKSNHISSKKQCSFEKSKDKGTSKNKLERKVSKIPTKSQSVEKIKSERKSIGRTANFCGSFPLKNETEISVQNKTLKRNNKYDKCQLLDKVKGIDKFDSKQILPTRQMKVIDFKTKMFGPNQSSLVKKLTSYWNTILNNDLEDFSTPPENLDLPCVNKSLQNLARRIYHEAGIKSTGTSLNDRSQSESSEDISEEINAYDSLSCHDKILEKVCGCIQNIDIANSRPATFTALENLDTELEFENKKKIPDGVIEELNTKETDWKNTKLECDLKTNDAVEAMRILTNKLKLFPELPLISEKLSLSQSLKTMMCLMTATVQSSIEDIFVVNLEDELSVEIEETTKADNIDKDEEGVKNVQVVAERNDVLVPVNGITLRKVEEALSYYSLCKDYLWSKFVSDQTMFGGKEDSTPPFFAFVYEGEIVLENEYDQEESGSDPGDDEATLLDVLRRVARNILEDLADRTAEAIISHYPDSVEYFVKSLYQASVTVLIWWIIMKELFLK